MAETNPAGKLVNRRARPRVAAVGFWATQNEILDSIEPLCGTLYRHTLPNLSEVDLIISRGGLEEPLPAHVLLWGPDGSHEIQRPSNSTWMEAASQDLWEMEYQVPIPHDFAQAARRGRRKGEGFGGSRLIEMIRPEIAVIGRSEQIGHEIYQHSDLGRFEPGASQLVAATRSDPSRVLGIDSLRVGEVPLVWTSDGSLAALYSPTGDEKDRRDLDDIEVWQWYGLSIPPQADLKLWLRCFLEFLHTVDRGAVPRRPPLLGSPSDWNTPDQIVLAREISALESEIGTLLNKRGELLEKVEALGSAADAGVRRVLWSKDDELVEAVASLLRDLGFEVTEVDQEVKPNEAKWEDLRVEAPGLDAVVIGEVKGYPNDAKVSDLSQIRAQRERHLRTESTEPISWWIFNDHRNTPDPSDRPPSLRGHVDRVEGHAVVAIPTRDLYRLWRAVGVGDITKEAARQVLSTTEPGLFSYLSSEYPQNPES